MTLLVFAFSEQPAAYYLLPIMTMPGDIQSDASPKPWVAHRGNSTPENEELLIGNRPGLELLRRKLDDALATGECRIDEGGVEFRGIRLVESDPRAETAVKPGGAKDAMRLLGCGIVGFATIFIFLAGLHEIWSWMK